MASFAKKLIQQSAGLFNLKVKKEIAFFDKPPKLKAISAAALTALSPLATDLKDRIQRKVSTLSADQIIDDPALQAFTDPSNITDDDVTAYVKRNNNLQRLVNALGNELNESVASDITIACENEDFENESVARFSSAFNTDTFDGNSFLRLARSSSDFDQAIQNNKNKEFRKFPTTVLAWMLLIYYLIINIQNYITSTRYPSRYRTKYLQKQIRNLGIMLKEAAGQKPRTIQDIQGQRKTESEKEAIKEFRQQRAASASEAEREAIKKTPTVLNSAASLVKAEFDNLFGALKIFDAIVLAVSTASILYLNNRGNGQEHSTNFLNEETLKQTCNPIDDADASTLFQPLDLSLNGFACPIPDNIITPQLPFDQRLEEFACPLPETFEDPSIVAKLKADTATNALFENLSEDKFDIFVQKDWTVNAETVLGSIGKSKIYSGLEGTVNKIEADKVYLKDIREPEQNPLEAASQELNGLYTELSNSKEFIKLFYMHAWYSPMLNASPGIDSSISYAERVKIFYKTGGVEERWNNIVNGGNQLIEDFNNTMQNNSDPGKIKAKAEGDNLLSIKEDLDKAEDILFKGLNTLADRGINQSKITLPLNNEFLLLEYWIEFYSQLIALEPNDIINRFATEVNGFINERFFTDLYEFEYFIELINRKCRELNVGTYNFEEVDYFETMTDFYEQGGNPESVVRNYIESLGKKNTDLNTQQKQRKSEEIFSLFMISRNITSQQAAEYIPKQTNFKQTSIEANFVENFFAQLNLRIEKEIPEEIEKLNKKIEDFADSFKPPSIITIDDEEYQYIGVKGPERVCPVPEEDDPYLSPATEYGLADFPYWLKYCAFATLASVANPVSGWSTGLPPPIGPIPFPVVYIPFKSFETRWGFIVIGLTITGIFPFPWVLFTNYTAQYNTPLGDPTIVIKNEIDGLKKTITQELKNYRQDILRGYLNDQRAKVDEANTEVEDLEEAKRVHVENKPERERPDPDAGVKEKLEVRRNNAVRLQEWTTVNGEYIESINVAKGERFVQETKYKIVKDAFDGLGYSDTPDPKIEALEKQEELLNAQLDKLDALVDSIDDFLAPLPISMEPESANFAITPKNTRPIIQIANELQDNINYGPLDKVVDKFSLQADDFMSSKFNDKAGRLSYGNYKKALRGVMPAIVKKDPFPKYENLKLGNIAWNLFLLKEWSVKGAQTFGFPGQPPLPLG